MENVKNIESTILDSYKSDSVDINYLWAERLIDSDRYKKIKNMGADILEAKLRENTLKSEGAVELGYIESRDKTNKNTFKKRIISLILASVLAVSVYAGGKRVIDHVKLESAYSEAYDFMNDRIYEYLIQADVGFEVVDNKNVILECNQEKLRDFYNIMNQYMDRDVMFLAVSETLGKDAFDKMAQLDGFENGEDFLKNYYFSGDIYEGGSYVYKNPDYNRFKNNNQVQFIESVQRIKSEINNVKGV